MKKVDSFNATIFIAGDVAQAKQVCREYCRDGGLCVTIEPTTFIYTGGEEPGVRVGLLNYPRFQIDSDTLVRVAVSLAEILRHKLCQDSWLIYTPIETIWSSKREVA